MLSAKLNNQEFSVGDTVRVHSKVVEGTRARIQVFEGIVIRIRGHQENATFTVRRIGAGGIGVERIWPVDSKTLEKIEVKKKGINVRRSKLFYLRDLTGKSAVRV